MSEPRGVSIKVEGLRRTFFKADQQIDVLQGVDLELGAGERMAIIGPSGSGKSTFLQILGTLDHPTGGTVRFDDRDVFSLPRREIDRLRNQQIGFIFQFHHLLPDQDAQANVALPMIIQGRSARDAAAAARRRLERVGLGHRLNHKPGELSGGEQQRVAIARALVMGPRLLLADEPTGNLDPRTADSVFDLVMELNEEEGATLVVVTHSESIARRFPRVMRVVDGRLGDA